MIKNSYFFLGHEKHETGLYENNFCYIEILTLLNIPVTANYGRRFAYGYKEDFLERRVNFLNELFAAKGLDCTKTINAFSSPEDGGPAAIYFSFSPAMADAVKEVATEIEAAAEKSRLVLAPYLGGNILSHPTLGSTIFTADFKKLNDQQTSDALEILTSAFAAHDVFNFQTSIDNQTPDKTAVTLTFPYNRYVTVEITVMEIANAAARAQGGTPLQALRQTIPTPPSGSANPHEMN